jgi:hypothetical protein
MTTKRTSSARAPLTDQELSDLTVEQQLKLKLTDDEITRLRKIIIHKREARQKVMDEELKSAEPIVKALNVAGVPVRSLWDLDKIDKNYLSFALPVLCDHLVKPYPESVLGGIVNYFNVPEGREYWDFLVEQYQKRPNLPDYFNSAKDRLAATLAMLATDKELDQIIDLIRDPNNGGSRLLFLLALKKSRQLKAKVVIEELQADPFFSKEINSWRRGKPAIKAPSTSKPH